MENTKGQNEQPEEKKKVGRGVERKERKEQGMETLRTGRKKRKTVRQKKKEETTKQNRRRKGRHTQIIRGDRKRRREG